MEPHVLTWSTNTTVVVHSRLWAGIVTKVCIHSVVRGGNHYYLVDIGFILADRVKSQIRFILTLTTLKVWLK